VRQTEIKSTHQGEGWKGKTSKVGNRIKNEGSLGGGGGWGSGDGEGENAERKVKKELVVS